MTNDLIKLKNLIENDLQIDLPDDFDADLFDEGLLDSYSLIKLLDLLEANYGLKISPQVLTAKNFATIHSILDLITNLNKK